MVQKLREFFSKTNWVKLAFLFGSQASGRTVSESDFDIGIWPEEGTAEGNISKLSLELERLLKKPVDLVILPNAAPIVAGEAFRGIPLVIRDERFYISKMLEVSQEAEDFQDFVMDIWRAREESRI